MRFRKKPAEIEIEAVQLTREGFAAARDFVPIDSFAGGGEGPDGRVFLEIRTLEGTMRANEGDWIIRGVAGEFYPCNPFIFNATYEPVPTFAVLDLPEPEAAGPACDGLCLDSADIGVPGYGIAYAHPGCPLHGADEEV
jgi:hypothetical protein